MSSSGKPSASLMDVHAIASRLPHRFPFLLVDRVIELESGKRIVAIKNVTIDEPFFPGHFPEQPIMPGVLICEALVQAGALLGSEMDDRAGPGGQVLVLAALEHVRFRRVVVPGDQLRLEVELLGRRRFVWRMRGEARVEGELAAEAEFMVVERKAGGVG